MKILKGDEYPTAPESFHEGFNAGASAVLAIRCIDHRAVPMMNNAASGCECPICEVEVLSLERNRLKKIIRDLAPFVEEYLRGSEPEECKESVMAMRELAK